ncbi:D-(-)-3-hydroxybutyrate oligomer hydrolase [Janthinobacterium sp. GW460P]|uniref:3-hydroxybutyrate oligomer hydrolase family protein n=2 Tax=unclassified Janthinobacterium TaxID=2610881 RepID=UPI000A328188|nr:MULTISPECIES: 3-hydroxybutyrate oligomer hydrolase family protein [unclassified Janthinobacterium]MCC7703486.1 D-(-)-3-hydroxybutyrate oligomer hydrolase [Janthinobacterium sp. GW460P]MCC7708993.1 D-(-)-3-hydroxybutyrate oligomer hydrolase [Janthinobacterium sp. GW460W]
MQMTITRAGTGMSLCTLLALAACGSNHAPEELNQMPSYLGTITRADYDGKTNDLLTAGLGKTGLAGATPAYANAEQPTPLELRRNAIYANYRAVLDIAANSGYGTLYGPNVDASGNVGTGEGLVAGSEYIAYADDGTGRKNVTLMVQVPASFDPDRACIVTGTSSGSRGIYGAIGSSGEWGLKKGCAVAYADKGSGTGLYVFEDDSVNLQNGVRAGRVAAGKNALFAPDLNDADRLAWASAYPNRIAFKHAHSQQNPEKDWGKVTLQAVEMAYYVLNERYGVLARDGSSRLVRLTPKNTITIASSISNGAGSALLAAEQDTKGLIHGVAASEPQIQPAASNAYSVRQGGVLVANPGRALFDYATYAALYQPCIAAVAGNAGRCTALVSKGLLNGADLAAQQVDAKQRLRAYGWLADSDPLQAAHAGTNILVAVTYAYAYGKFSVTDNVCGFTFAQTDGSGNPIAFTTAQKAASFAAQNGILGNVVYENSVGGAKVYTAGVSPSTSLADQSLDGFLCLRGLATGRDAVSGATLQGTLATQSVRVRTGMAEVAASGKLNGKPAIIVHGRSDTLIPVNHASRAYLGLNAAVEGANSQLRYIEVSNANHFDSFSSALPTLIVPLHVYLNRALDAMYAHLNAKQALPPSQVVRTVTRADASTLITNVNVPAIAATPAPGNVISVTGTQVDIPN